MDEVFRIADRVTVMRDGCYISSFPREQLEETSLISMMVGREIKNMFPKSNTPNNGRILPRGASDQRPVH